MRRSALSILSSVLFVCALLCLTSCTGDDDNPSRAVPDEGGEERADGEIIDVRGGVGGGGPGPVRDVGAGDLDAGSDADVPEYPDGGVSCPLPPHEVTDLEREPCCFSDLDCNASGHPQSLQMRCYGARCVSGQEGVCRVPPFDDNLCWSDRDCRAGEVCKDAILGSCRDSFRNDHPGYCGPA